MIKFIQKNMNKKGFTLVELIIVIAVMAILAAIVIPRMTGITTSFKLKADERLADTYARELEVKVQIGTQTAAAIDDLTHTILGETVALETPASTGTWFYYIAGTNVYVGVYTGSTLPTAAQITGKTAPVTVSVVRENVSKIED